jgi:hypothetical protein
MTQLAALARLVLSGGRLLLPLVAISLVSASLAFAMNGALGGGTSAMDQQPDLQVSLSTGNAATPTTLERSQESLFSAPTDPAGSSIADSCAAFDGRAMRVGLDSWIVAETRNIACGSERP